MGDGVSEAWRNHGVSAIRCTGCGFVVLSPTIEEIPELIRFHLREDCPRRVFAHSIFGSRRPRYNIVSDKQTNSETVTIEFTWGGLDEWPELHL